MADTTPTPTPTPVPTQVKRPWRATLRTAVATAVVVVPLLALIVPQAVQVILDESGDALPDHFRTFLLGVSAVVVTGAAIVTRIMALPAVEVLLRRYLPKLAAEPTAKPAKRGDDGTYIVTDIEGD